MLAIHITHNSIKYAQLVNFKGTPFIESLGKVGIKEGLLMPDMSNGEVMVSLASQIAKIRNSAEFPDNSTHIVIDSDWFPLGIHQVDATLSGSDLNKFLKWRMDEMLESAASQFSLVHQELSRSSEKGVDYITIGIPITFDAWLQKIFASSELEIKKVITEIQALGDILAASGLLDTEGGIQVVMDNRENCISCHLYQKGDFIALFQASLNWDYKITIDHSRGDYELITQVKESIEKAIKGKRDPQNVITNLFYFTSAGDDTVLNNLKQYPDSCKILNLVQHFNFRDPEYQNIDEYAVVLGALSMEIQERFHED